MKLLILLSLIASSYGDKLDRTYLPPANAASAGGAGALTAPGVSFGTTGPSNQGFGQQTVGLATPFGQANQQPSRQQYSGSNFESKRPNSFGFTSGAGVGKPSSVYGSANSRPSQGNNGFSSGFGPSGSQGENQPFAIANTPSEDGQQPTAVNASPFAYRQTSGQNFLGTPSRVESERPQAAADRNAEILKYVNENDGNQFSYSFETSNGINAEEAGTASGGVKAQGGYSYTGDDGKSYTITYTADEQGYQPQGEHLPTPHPIPEEILRSIEKNAQAAAAGTQEGAYRPEDYDSEENSQGYSGTPGTPGNKPQRQNQFSVQQYNPTIDRSPNTQIGSQQIIPENQKQQNSYSPINANGASNVEPIRSSDQKIGSNNQAQPQRTPGYQYSRPQNTQEGSPSKLFGNQPSQSRPQFGSQFPSDSPFSTQNGQDFNPINGASRPDWQNRPRDQDVPKQNELLNYQEFKPNANKPGQRTQANLAPVQNYNQGLGYQYQPGTPNTGITARPTFSKQPSFSNFNQGATPQGVNQFQANPSNQYSNRPSINDKYQPQNAQGSGSSQNGAQNQASVSANNNLPLGFPSSSTKASAPIQAPYQYQRPSQQFNQNKVSQNGFRQPLSQVPSTMNKPSFGSPQAVYNQPIQSQSPFNQNSVQGGQNYPSQIQGSSSPSLNRGQDQGSRLVFSGNRPEQFNGPRQPPSYNPEEGYKY